MLYLIDGYNLIFCTPFRASTLEKMREKAINFLTAHLDHKKHQVVIVFDGQVHKNTPFNSSHLGNIKVVFSYEGESADDEMIHILERQKNCRNTTLISSDLRVKRVAEQLGSKTLLIDDFLNLVEKQGENSLSQATKDTMTDDENAQMVKLFEERFSNLD